MSNITKGSQACSCYVNEQHVMKYCYTRHKRNAGDKGEQEVKETKLSQEKEYGLILSNVQNQ